MRKHNSEEHSYISLPLSFIIIIIIIVAVESEKTVLSKITDPKWDEKKELEKLYNGLLCTVHSGD
jgi:hypothetical protein